MAGQRRRAGFTLTEVLVVIGVIIVLVGILATALSGAFTAGKMTSAINNLRQISTMMQQYSKDSREYIVPSQFDYSPAVFTYKGHVRSGAPVTGAANQGTWTDILWVYGEVAALPYQFDSPDEQAYRTDPDITVNPFRSTAPNTRDAVGDGTAIPFGTGADEAGLPGYFAANDFFNARPDAPTDWGATPPPATGRWYTQGQIKAPDRSMYLVDSFAGEVIGLNKEPWDVDGGTAEVDFRYNSACLMLFLDGHTEPQSAWANLSALEQTQRIRISNPLGN